MSRIIDLALLLSWMSFLTQTVRLPIHSGVDWFNQPSSLDGAQPINASYNTVVLAESPAVLPEHLYIEALPALNVFNLAK